MHDHHDHHDDHEEEEVALREWDEFPPGADAWEDTDNGVSRRNFVKHVAAGLAMAGLVGCNDRPKNEVIVPHVNPTPGVIPGRPLVFATAMVLSGFAQGILAISREGRPVKIEGNPDHPANLGGTNVFMQASILDMYDPARAKSPARAGSNVDWPTFWSAIQPKLDAAARNGGAGLRVLSGLASSPTLISQFSDFVKKFPQARWHHYDPVAGSYAGSVAAFGRPLDAVYDFSKAKTIVSLDHDFLFADPGSLRYARQFTNGRRVRHDQFEMNRLYVVESTLSITGSVAEHRLAVPPQQILAYAQALSAAVAGSGATPGGADARRDKWVAAAAEDLRAHRGASLVVAGASQPAEVHALVHAINFALGNVGQTVTLTEPILAGAGDETRSLKALVDDMNAGRVETLLIFGDNPAFTAPADVAFADALRKLSNAKNPDGVTFKNFTAHLGLYANETSFLCQWQLPESHYLEAWGDARAFDGTASIIQPLITPLYTSRSQIEVMARLMGGNEAGGYEVVRGYWRGRATGDFEGWWHDTLKRGTVAGSAALAVNVAAPKLAPPATQPAVQQGLTVVFRPDYSVWDGTFNRNSWLQELPRPFSKIVWDNAALISPKTMTDMGVEQDAVIKLSIDGRSVELPVYALPGIPDNTVTVNLGYGAGQRPPAGEFDIDLSGFNAYAIRTSATPGFSAVQWSKTGRTHKLVATRSHHAIGPMDAPHGDIRKDLAPNAVVTPQTDDHELNNNSRRLIRIFSVGEFKADPGLATKLGGLKETRPLLSLYDRVWDYTKGYQWGMSIDTTACIGCNACVVACQSENNIHVVGKGEVARQRDMHWLRIDSYFAGENAENPMITHQPLPCMHCEDAPCEYVCPVGATSHSDEGLNQMTYNRCVGTRYCSNNCPYKVRRFNFLDYTKPRDNPQRMLQSNPEVTVRTRGVMEKCTYCVQRIEKTRIDVGSMMLDLQDQSDKTTDQAVKDRIKADARKREFEMIESLQSACAQACPTQAIIFGSINQVAEQDTKVRKLRNEPLNYSLLWELSTRPRTTYMARVRNPNPALEAPPATKPAAHGGHGAAMHGAPAHQPEGVH